MGHRRLLRPGEGLEPWLQALVEAHPMPAGTVIGRIRLLAGREPANWEAWTERPDQISAPLPGNWANARAYWP